MLSILVFIFFGWPAILASVVVSVIGLNKSNYRLLVVAAILAFGPCWFLSGFPVVASPIFLSPLLLFGAAFLLSRRHEMIAWIVAIPYYLIVFLLIQFLMAQA
jgi:hypothetical protein